MRLNRWPRSGRLGETRTRHVQAWLPTRANDGFLYWLERMTLVEVFERAGFRAGWRCVSVTPWRLWQVAQPETF
jgi:hypothetical protein